MMIGEEDREHMVVDPAYINASERWVFIIFIYLFCVSIAKIPVNSSKYLSCLRFFSLQLLHLELGRPT
jgi:hypothetical protein